MGRRGRKRQLGIEDEYWRLILGGVGTVERPADEPASAARPGTGGEPSTAGARRSGWRRQCAAKRYLSQFECQRIATLRDRA